MVSIRAATILNTYPDNIKIIKLLKRLKKKKKNDLLSVKFIKAVKTPAGNYKFNEKFVQVEDLNKLSEVK